MLGYTLIECSSDKRIIVDLTFSTDQIHSFSVFQSKYLRNKITGLTTHLMKAYSTSFWNDDLLFNYPHFSLITTSVNFVNTNTQVQRFILIEKLMVLIDSDDSLQTSRRLTHEPVRSDDEIIHSITRM